MKITISRSFTKGLLIKPAQNYNPAEQEFFSATYQVEIEDQSEDSDWQDKIRQISDELLKMVKGDVLKNIRERKKEIEKEEKKRQNEELLRAFKAEEMIAKLKRGQVSPHSGTEYKK